MEIALIPGVLALGETIACQLACAAAESKCRSQTDSNASRSHPGIYSNLSDVSQTRTHSGIYCNRAPKQRALPALSESESQTYCLAPQGSEDVYSEALLSSRYGSEIDSPCPTARLVLPQEECARPSEARPEAPDMAAHSPYTRSLLMPPQEQLCPLSSGSPFGMSSPTYKCEKAASVSSTSSKTSAANAYLLTLDLKNLSSASISTSSTCSDLDSSGTLSTVSLNGSSASDLQSPTSVCCDAESPRSSEMKTSVPFGASPIDAREGTSATAPVSKARMFCRQAFAECDFGQLG